MVRPGPHFSVLDVHLGWFRAFQELGVDVQEFRLDDRLDFFTQAMLDSGLCGIPDDVLPPDCDDALGDLSSLALASPLALPLSTFAEPSSLPPASAVLPLPL